MQPAQPALPQFIFVDHGINIQQTVSDFICDELKASLPDLSNIHLLVPAPDLIYTFRRILLKQLKQSGYPAFIGANISPIKKWIEQNILPQSADHEFINNHARQLIILEALQQYPTHFKDENLWQVATALLQLFEELTLYQLEIENFEEQQWIDRIKELYSVDINNQHLTSEARLIYTLWKAWQEQINNDEILDNASTYIQRIESLDSDKIVGQKFIMIGTENYSANEILFFKKLAESNQLYFFVHGNCDDVKNSTHPDYFLSRLISAFDIPQENYCQDSNNGLFLQAFRHEMSLQHRSQAYLNEATVPGQPDEFNVFAANSEEQEVSAIDLQIRQWLIEGKRNIAVVTENRKLARRIRAQLERAGVNLIDSVGWSLSTTSAATVVEKWLECIEQDFNATSFLDFLKSPYYRPGLDDDYLENIYRFEKDLVLYENITGNLERYRQALVAREHRLQHWGSHCYQAIDSMLLQLKKISTQLLPLFQQNIKIKASVYVKALIDSLQSLNLYSRLENDEAGSLVIDELTHMLNACKLSDPEMNWYDFRIWFASSLENHHYSPSSKASNVRLLNLKQSNSGHYQGLIIASCDATQLPGPCTRHPFFNNNLRREFGLPDWQQQKSEKFYLFRRLLQSADNVLATYCAEKNNEEQQPSPWLQTVIDFYHAAGISEQLQSHFYPYLNLPTAQVVASSKPAACENSQSPTPEISAADIPAQLSSSGHQRLINCPYQFFSSDVLKLSATDEIIRELQKSEYGEKVHKILEKFHSDSVSESSDPDLQLTKLIDISKNIFSQDIEDNFLHRGWLKRWLDHCEAYLNWQNNRNIEWRFKSAEHRQETEIHPAVQLKGRIDRIDIQTAPEKNQLGIIDYKTSSKTASQTDVDTGEDVQLSSYSLMQDQVCQVEYLKLDEQGGKVSSGASLQNEELTDNAENIRKRLVTIINQLTEQLPLIANGNETSCRYCDFSGLCRQAYWKQNSTQ